MVIKHKNMFNLTNIQNNENKNSSGTVYYQNGNGEEI